MSRLTLWSISRTAITAQCQLTGTFRHLAIDESKPICMMFDLQVEQGTDDVSATIIAVNQPLRCSITLDRKPSTASRICQWIEEVINGEPISAPEWSADDDQQPDATDSGAVLQHAIRKGVGTYSLSVEGVTMELELREWHSCNCMLARLHIAGDEPDVILAFTLPESYRAALSRLREYAGELATGHHNAHRAA